MTDLQIVTIGVYGFSEEEFFGKLIDAKVDLFCDVRMRRGVRGAKYSFVNSQRLQAKLAELGIAYIHRKDLAPTKQIRAVQHATDKSAHIAKRKREELSPEFVEAYKLEILADFDSEAFLHELPDEIEVIAFFCVEHAPEACHRSLVADKLAIDNDLRIVHIT